MSFAGEEVWLPALQMKRGLILKSVIAALAVAVSYIVYFIKPSINLDVSWMTALNYFAENGISFGRDLVWTYGPLGWALFPSIGSRLFLPAIIFQSALWFVLLAALLFAIFNRGVSLLSVIIFSLIFIAGGVFHANPDIFILSLTIFFLALALTGKSWYKPFIVALAFSAVLWFMKFSSAFMSSCAVFVFILIAWRADSYIGRRALALSVLTAVTFVLLPYLIYIGSLSGMIDYFRGVKELILGYSAAMSLPSLPVCFGAVITLMIFFMILIAMEYRSRKVPFYVCLIALLPMLIALKLFIVRSDIIHASIFYKLSFYIFAITFLFTNFKSAFFSKKRIIVTIAIVLLSVVTYQHAWKNVFAIWLAANRFPVRFTQIEKAGLLSLPYLDNSKPYPSVRSGTYLDSELVKRLKNKTVMVFPTEASIAIANNLNLNTMPVIQAYAAYTPYLDHLVARYMKDPARSPDYILFRWRSVDGRNPLVDVPATWLAMYKHYCLDTLMENGLLLKRLKEPRFRKLKYIESKEADITVMTGIPLSALPVVASIDMGLNLKGRIIKMIGGIPQVRIQFYDGVMPRGDFRVVPATLGDGLIINYIPGDLDTFAQFMKEDSLPYSVSGFRIYGPGIKYYKKHAIIRYSECDLARSAEKR